MGARLVFGAIRVFITFEGTEGAGKSTQLSLLAGRLAAVGVSSMITREPGGTPFGEKVRALFLQEELDAYSEVLLMLAMRRDHINTRIGPALGAGQWVLCDRYIDSTLAYQGRHLAPSLILELHKQIEADLLPDLTFILCGDVQAGLQRKAAQECNRFEQKPLSFHEEVHSAYQRLAQENPQRCVLIPGTQTPEETADIIWGVVKKHV